MSRGGGHRSPIDIDIRQLVEALPEIYQNIYGHEEYDPETSRRCRERESIIKTVVENYRKSTGKAKLKVLDLGCAQGYYSFTIADMGNHVDGIDFLDKNVALCNGLQAENGLDCSFREQEINQQMIDSIEDNSYDIILFFSVVHHICHNHGFGYARKLFSTLAIKGSIVLSELAIKKEPLYWNKNLPVNYEDWFTDVKFYKELHFFGTHLSDIERPFLIYSSEYCYANDIFYNIVEYHKSAHSGKGELTANRYYICDNNLVMIKYCRVKGNRSIDELDAELHFINTNRDLDFVPKVIGTEYTNDYRLLSSKIHYGKTLRELLKTSNKLDFKKIFSDILVNCVAMEERGVYQGDMRAWNVCVNEVEAKAFVIDFGFVQLDTTDHILQAAYGMPEYPITVYDAFVAMVYDCLALNGAESVKKITEDDLYLPTLEYDFTKLPDDYAYFFKRFLALKECEISFAKLYNLFLSMDDSIYTFTDEEKKRIEQKLSYAKYLTNELSIPKWQKGIRKLKQKLMK